MSAHPEIVPDPSFEEAERTLRYWDDHYEEFLAGYPEQFVAVRDGIVVASAAAIADLVDRLGMLGLDPRSDVIIQFITAESARLLL